MILGVIDGQGGSIGSQIVGKLRGKLPAGWEILALGTNASATRAMLEAGADSGATGEGAVVWNALRCEALAGPLGVVLANSIMGEITPRMAEAISSSPAEKFLVPISACGIRIAGLGQTDTSQLVDDLIDRLTTWALDPGSQPV